MAYTRNWDENQPTDNQYGYTTGEWFRGTKIDIAERLKDWIYGFISGETKIGLKKAPLHPVSSDPATESDKGILYVKEVDGVKELFYLDSSGNVKQITKEGDLNFVAFESGDILLTTKDTTPEGWEDLSSTYDNRFIRISSGIPLETGGSDMHSHTLTVDNLPSHSHNAGTLATTSSGAHTHTVTILAGRSATGNGYAGQDSSNTDIIYGTAESAGAHTHTITGSTGTTGSGTSFSGENIPAYIQVRMLRKL